MAFGNVILDNLSDATLVALRPHLHRVEVERHQVLIEQDEPVLTVHFPLDCQLANLNIFEDAEAVETSVIGREGMSGLSPFLACAACPWRVQVRKSGTAIALAVRPLQLMFDGDRVLRERLMRLTLFYQAQAAQTAACNATHRISSRVARWLLTASDLTPDQPIHFTQEEMATLLGAQRTTVVDAMQALKAAGAVRYGRGRIQILSRARVEAQACSCYRYLRHQAQQLKVLPEAGEAA